MENAPAFQFYPSELLGNMPGFTDLAKAKLLLLIANLWLQKKQGFAKNDDFFLSSICACELEEWKNIKKHALNLGLIEETDDGFIFFPYLLKQLEKQAERRRKLAENGSKGGLAKAKAKQNVAIAKQKLSLSTSSLSSSSTEVEDPPLPPDGGNEKKLTPFDEFYEKYPKKTYKQQSEVFWNKNKLDAKLPEILEGLNRYKVSDLWTKEKGAYVCDSIRFLTKERWRDDPEPARLHAVKRPVGTMLGGNEITPAHLRPNGPIQL